MKAYWFKILLIGCLVLFLAACNQIGAPTMPDETLSPTATTLPINDTQPEPDKDGTLMTQQAEWSFTSGMELLIEKAKEDLAQRLGISVDSVTVAAVIGQEFSTDAFNCRTSKERIAREEPPQVVSGQSILLRASGRRYEYHASGQTVIFCRPLN